jgi:putative FmdB family regulatory protein
MPTYEYLCDACEHQFEEFQSFTAEPLTKCPECGKKKLRRLLGSGAAVIFKGSGFYETDYRSDSYKAAAKADQEAASKPSTTTAASDSNGSASSGEKAKSTGKSSKEKG